MRLVHPFIFQLQREQQPSKDIASCCCAMLFCRVSATASLSSRRTCHIICIILFIHCWWVDVLEERTRLFCIHRYSWCTAMYYSLLLFSCYCASTVKYLCINPNIHPSALTNGQVLPVMNKFLVHWIHSTDFLLNRLLWPLNRYLLESITLSGWKNNFCYNL